MFWAILMVGIVLFFIIGLTIDVIRGYESIGDAIVSGLISIAFTVMGCMLLFLVASGFASLSKAEVEYTIVSEQQICALQDNHSEEGVYFLGCGQSEDRIKYTYLVEEEFGYKMRQIDSEKAVLRIDGNPRIVCYKGAFKNKVLAFFASYCGEHYVIYCPEGAILQEYNVDLQ